jgi:hypothetical protein
MAALPSCYCSVVSDAHSPKRSGKCKFRCPSFTGNCQTPHTYRPRLHRHAGPGQPPGFSGDGWGLPGYFPSGLCMKNFNRTFAEKLWADFGWKKFQVSPSIKISHDPFIMKKIPCHFPNIRSSYALFRSYPACSCDWAWWWWAGSASGGKRGECGREYA